jgi:hypothetical protein
MKKKSNKLTGKQVEGNLVRLYQEQGQLGQIINSIGSMLVQYIEYKGDKDGFAEYSTKKEEEAAKSGESEEA